MLLLLPHSSSGTPKGVPPSPREKGQARQHTGGHVRNWEHLYMTGGKYFGEIH